MNKLLKSPNRVNFLWRLMQIISRQGVSFIIFLFSAKLLSSYDLGIYSYVMAIVSLSALACDFGLSTSVAKISAELSHAKDKRHSSILPTALSIAALLALAISGLILILGKEILGQSYQFVLLALPLIFFMPAVSIMDGFFRSLKNFKKLSLINLTLGTIFTLLALVATHIYGLTGAILIQSYFYFALFIFLLIYSGSKLARPDKSLFLGIGRSSLTIGLISLGFFLYTKADILILKQAGLVEFIGLYEMLNKVVLIISMPFMVFAAIVGPNISRLFVDREWESINKLFRVYVAKALTISALLALLIFIPLTIFLKYLFPSFDHQMIVTLVAIILLIYPVQTVADIAGNGFIIYTGFSRLNLVILLIFGALNVIGDIYSLNYFGAYGFIWSKLAIGFGLSISLVAVYTKKLAQRSEALRVPST